MSLEDAIAALEKEISNELSRLGMPNLTEPLFDSNYDGKIGDLQKEIQCSVCGKTFVVVMTEFVTRWSRSNQFVPEYNGFWWSTKHKEEPGKWWALCSKECEDLFNRFTEIIKEKENESWQQLWYAKRILKQARLLVREKFRGV